MTKINIFPLICGYFTNYVLHLWKQWLMININTKYEYRFQIPNAQ